MNEGTLLTAYVAARLVVERLEPNMFIWVLLKRVLEAGLGWGLKRLPEPEVMGL
jgi:uncharacterized membrane protein